MIDFFQRRRGAGCARPSRRRCPRSRSTASSRSRPSCARSAGVTSSRSTSRSSSTRSCTCSARSRSSTAACRFGGRWRRWSPARPLAFAAAHRRCPARRRLRAPRPGRDAGAPRVLGRAPAQLAVPCRGGDLLVRGAGAGRRARASGDLRGDDRSPPAARPARARLRRRARHARRARLRRDALALARRAAGVARVHGRSRRPLPVDGRPQVSRCAASSTRRTST